MVCNSFTIQFSLAVRSAEYIVVLECAQISLPCGFGVCLPAVRVLDASVYIYESGYLLGERRCLLSNSSFRNCSLEHLNMKPFQAFLFLLQ